MRENVFDKLPSAAVASDPVPSLAPAEATCHAVAPQKAGQGRQRSTVRDLS
jgi:hypothetical protein